MATAYPRLPPPPMSFAPIATDFAVHMIRVPLLTALAHAYIVFPVYDHLIRWWAPWPLAVFFVLGTLVIHESLYFGCNTAFLMFDKYKIFLRYKIPRKDSQIPSDALVKKTIRQGAISHFLAQPLTAYVAFHLFVFCGMRPDGPQPSLWTVFAHIAFADFVNDLGFYITHRAFHSKGLYKFHKQHHEYLGTIGFAAEYAHPLEVAISNQLPTVLGLLVLGSHVSVWFIWLAFRLWNTYEGHSGYSFKGSWLDSVGLLHAEGARHHDLHHSNNYGNFGSTFFDYLGGTFDWRYLHVRTPSN